MQKWLRRILIYLATAFVLLFGTAYLLVWLYRDEIRTSLLTETNKHISGKINVGEIDFTFFKNFPKVSVTLVDASIQDSVTQHYLFRAEKVFFHVSVADIFFNKLSVSSVVFQNAAVSIVTDSTGYSPLQAFKNLNKRTPEKDKKPPKMKIELEEVGFENVSVSVVDSVKHKYYGFLLQDTRLGISKNAEGLSLRLDGPVFFKGLAFNTRIGSFLSETATELHLKTEFNPLTRQLTVFPSHVLAQEQDIVLSGFFNFNETPGLFRLSIENNKADVEICKKLLTHRLQLRLKKYHLNAPVKVALKLKGSMGQGQEAEADLTFSAENAMAAIDTLQLTQTSLTGIFTNHVNQQLPPGPTNTRLSFPRFSAQLDGNPVVATATITNLTNPFIDLRARASVHLKDSADLVHTAIALFKPKMPPGLLKLKTDKPVMLRFRIAGLMLAHPQVPLIELDFNTVNTRISYENYTAENVTFSGSFTNQADPKELPEIKNTKLVIRDFQGRIQDFPVTLKATLTHLDDPEADLETSFASSLLHLQRFMPKDSPLTLRQGIARFSLKYKGKVSDLNKSTLRKLPASLTGSLLLENAALSYNPQQISLTALHGTLSFTENDLKVHYLSGLVAEQPFNVSGKITAFMPFLIAPTVNDPYLDLAMAFNVSLKAFNNWLKTGKYRFETGNAALQVSYKGFLKNYTDRQRVTSRIRGTLTLVDGGFHYLPADFNYTKLTGTLVFDENELEIRHLSGFLNENQLLVQGRVTRLLPFFLLDNQLLTASLDVSSPFLNLDKIIRPKIRNKPIDRELRVIKNPDFADKNPLSIFNPLPTPARSLESILDELTEKTSTDIRLTAAAARYRQVVATNLSGNISLRTGLIRITDTGLKSANGTLVLNGFVDTSPKLTDKLAFNVNIKGVDVQQIFQEFENFHQDAIEDKNLRGELDADIQFSADLNARLRVIPETMKGELKFQLYNGQLIDFEPLANIQKVIFKKRDFQNIRFAKIENIFELNGLDIDIRKMEIESSVLGLFVDGKYSFAGNTDLTIQVPLKHILKRRKDFVPENFLSDAKTGANVFLRATSKNGKIHIQYDPFKKFRDKKEERQAEKERLNQFKNP